MEYEEKSDSRYKTIPSRRNIPKVTIRSDAPPLHLDEETTREIKSLLAWEERSKLVDWVVGEPRNY
mgnify:CR=1 FL=1|jgi:hypothetical protein